MNKTLKLPMLYDRTGKPVSPANKLKNNLPGKKALGLYGNLWAYPNWGRFRPRYYAGGDAAQGLDSLSREYLVRWSREMAAQLPFIKAAVRILADFSVGNAYKPQYIGKNTEWWKYAEEWLLNDWYPNCNVRGPHYDFQTSLKLESQLLDIDGDFLLVYGTENGFPKYQIIQNNRLRCQDRDNSPITEGPMAGTIISDGVYYTPQGKAVAYHINNAKNLVNTMVSQSEDVIFSAKDAHLCLDPEFIEKLRGVPSIGAGILQAVSLQEIDAYLMERIKIESTVALIQKTPSGEAPVELQNTLEQLQELTGAPTSGLNNITPNTHAIEIRQGGEMKYIHAEGGDLKSLASSTPGNETSGYIERLETQILATIGIPHTLVFSTDRVSGRVTSAVAEIFRAAIKRRQSILDKTAKFRVSWALSVAMEEGLIPYNEDENMSNIINFTKPSEFSLDARYDNDIISDNYQNGFSSLNDATIKLHNKTAEQVLDAQTDEQIMFYTRAKKVADKTGVDLPTVIAGWRYQQKITQPPEAPKAQDMDNTTH